MISVLTLTYKRRALLEEAIYSFLLQDLPRSEMLVVNDCPDVWYDFHHPRVRIYNLNERFPSIGDKLAYGFGECRYPHVYRLDDDDLLAPDALARVHADILANPDYDIYRSSRNYLFTDNQYEGYGGSVNNGNCYAQSYLQRVIFPTSNYGEDHAITFDQDAQIYTNHGTPTMCYRWGMGCYHVSGLGDVPTDVSYEVADAMGDSDVGYVKLIPQFRTDYWAMLPLAEMG